MNDPYNRERRSTTRSRLLYNMGPLLVLVIVMLVVGIYAGLLYGLLVSANHGNVAWTVAFGSLLICGSVQNGGK